MKFTYKKWLACLTVILSGILLAGFANESQASSGTLGYAVEGPKVALVSEGTIQPIKQAQVVLAKETFEKAKEEEAAILRRKEEERRKAEEAKRRAEEEQRRQQALRGDMDLMAAIIYCEAGNEPYEGQVAVGAVILNRIRSGRFPNTLREVIYQPGQFGPAMTGKLDRVLASGAALESCYRAAQDAFNGVNPIGDCLFFGDGRPGIITIGTHQFH